MNERRIAQVARLFGFSGAGAFVGYVTSYLFLAPMVKQIINIGEYIQILFSALIGSGQTLPPEGIGGLVLGGIVGFSIFAKKERKPTRPSETNKEPDDS